MGIPRAGWRTGWCGALLVLAAGAGIPVPVLAYAATLGEGGYIGFDPVELVAILIIAGFCIFAAAALALLWAGRRHRAQEKVLAGEIAALHGVEDRIRLILGIERQLIVSWSGRDEPKFEGDPTVAGPAMSGKRVLAFGSWVAAGDAAALEGALEALRLSGKGFHLVLRRLDGRLIEALGATCVGQAVLRLKDIGGEQAKLFEAQTERDSLQGDLDAVIGLIDSLAHPVWFRDNDDVLIWTNRAFLDAVEAKSLIEARERSLELLDRSARAESARLRRAGQPYEARVPAVMAGKRRVVDVSEQATPGGAAGIAIDVTDLEAMRSELRQQAEAHSRTLDQLPTAVAIFDKARKLTFYNSAYKALWNLPAAFLDGHPGDSEILDRLRTARLLPEQADFRAWKAETLSAYHALESREMWWYLPDRRTLRVVANPNPQGGLTYLFDDVSDRFRLETDFNAVLRVQGETLDTLHEGVAVFGSDGKLRLANRAFVTMWNLPEDIGAEHPHIDLVARQCRVLTPDETAWEKLRIAVASLPESREAVGCRIGRNDGAVFNCTAQPLPDGATLLTFSDITASENVARALTERNEALERAANVRDLFIHDVSYELRAPLTNIIGFTQLLGSEAIGPLNDKQREYSGDIERSSEALLALLDDIQDLAGLDAGSVELVPESVDIRETITAATRGIEDRLAENGLKLVIDISEAIGSFTADGKRVRQMLFHMLSDAVGVSSAGETVTVRARRIGESVLFSVADQGCSAKAMMRARAFQGRDAGEGHRGVGLQLAIVRQLVELHGGHFTFAAEPESGSVVSCLFPNRVVQQKNAAE